MLDMDNSNKTWFGKGSRGSSIGNTCQEVPGSYLLWDVDFFLFFSLSGESLPGLLRRCNTTYFSKNECLGQSKLNIRTE